MKKRLIAAALLVNILAAGCSKKDNETPDTEYPVIDVNATGSFPLQCSELTRGQTFTFRAFFSDNRELGSSSIDIHHNFDHHSHSTEVNDCEMDARKTPVKPFLLVKTFPIPAGVSSFEMVQEIAVPADIDPGDYHFLIRLTDREGWQTLRGISIRIR